MFEDIEDYRLSFAVEICVNRKLFPFDISFDNESLHIQNWRRIKLFDLFNLSLYGLQDRVPFLVGGNLMHPEAEKSHSRLYDKRFFDFLNPDFVQFFKFNTFKI